MDELMNFVQLCAPFPPHYLLHASPVIYHITSEVKFGRDLLVTPLQGCQLLGMKVDSATRHLGPPSDANLLEFPQPMHGQTCEAKRSQW